MYTLKQQLVNGHAVTVVSSFHHLANKLVLSRRSGEGNFSTGPTHLRLQGPTSRAPEVACVASRNPP